MNNPTARVGGYINIKAALEGEVIVLSRSVTTFTLQMSNLFMLQKYQIVSYVNHLIV